MAKTDKEKMVVDASEVGAMPAEVLGDVLHGGKPIEPSAKGVAQMTLPEVLGYVMTKVMTDRKLMNEANREFRVWYDAQPTENRQEIARKIKSDLEVACNVPQALFTAFRQFAYPDL